MSQDLTQSRSGPFICALTVTLLIPLLSAGAGFACGYIGPFLSHDFGAVEKGNSNPMSEVYDNPGFILGWTNNCSSGYTINSISSSDQSDFQVSNPSDDTPGCLPSYNLPPGSYCYFQVTFTPQGLGPQSTNISVVTSSETVGTVILPFAGAEFSVSPPTDGQDIMNDFPLMLPSPQPTVSPFYPGYASITLNSGTAQINWTGTLSYHSTGGIPDPQAEIAIKSFDTGRNKPQTIAFGSTPIPSGMATPTSSKDLYQVAGGKLALSAAYNAGGLQNDPVTKKLIGTVSGIPGGICDPAITSKLGQWKGPATDVLFEKIAAQESSYRQFSTVENFWVPPPPLPPPLYDVDTLWPLESPPAKRDGGYAIGLMMDQLDLIRHSKAEMSTAWNWLDNAQAGYDIFESKANIIARKIAPQVSKYSGLPALNSSSMMFEGMALFQYGGFANKPMNIFSQYYMPQCSSGPAKGTTCPNGTWQWVLNSRSPNGNAYVASVYSQTPPANRCSD